MPIHKGREVIYACFSRIFLNVPDSEVYAALSALVPVLKDMAAAGDDKLMKSGHAGLEKFVSKRGSFKEKELEEFDLEAKRAFTRLYCMTDSVPNSESVYLSPEHLVMQEQADKVFQIYSENGFVMDCPSNEPQDHISYELMFMSYMALIAAEAYARHDFGEGRRAETVSFDFIEAHLLKWLDAFLKNTISMPESLELYAPSIYFLQGYIRQDAVFLGESKGLIK